MLRALATATLLLALLGCREEPRIQPAAAPVVQLPGCRDTASLEAILLAQYDERAVSEGVDRRGRLVTVYAAPSGSWTILVMVHPGLSCLVSSGEGWRPARPRPSPVEPGEPA